MDHFLPTISVVVPVYNGECSIEACLASLLQQDYPKDLFEIIVVENGSTDRTMEIVQHFPVRLIQCDERGPAAARNKGVMNSQADIVAFTDADCIADPQWLRYLIQPYEDDRIGGVGGKILAYLHEGRNLVEVFSDDHAPLVNFISGKDEFLPHLYTANASYRRELFNKIGGFNPHLITAEDVDISWRLQLETQREISMVPDAVIYHHHRSTLKGLARQYRHYGYGEIILDTIYGRFPDYPRDLSFHIKRIIGQASILPKYMGSMVFRQIKRAFGKRSKYNAAIPFFWLVIESSSIRGKLEGLYATRGMTTFSFVQHTNRKKLIKRLYGG